MKRALVVIPTTGADCLRDAVLSVLRQSHEEVDCLVVIDGPEFSGAATGILTEISHEMDSGKLPNRHRLFSMALPWNTGKGGFNGHRILAAVPALMRQDYFLPLDQDNTFDVDHVATLIDCCETHDFDWCHSLRKICERDGTYVCDDNCESLGKHAPFLSHRPNLVDTSTYCVRREVIVELASAWHQGRGADRHFYSIISAAAPRFACTGKYTMNYRVDGNPNSPGSAFFIEGNRIMSERFQGRFPWLT